MSYGREAYVAQFEHALSELMHDNLDSVIEAATRFKLLGLDRSEIQAELTIEGISPEIIDEALNSVFAVRAVQ